jgi:hypothetical protein
MAAARPPDSMKIAARCGAGPGPARRSPGRRIRARLSTELPWPTLSATKGDESRPPNGAASVSERGALRVRRLSSESDMALWPPNHGQAAAAAALLRGADFTPQRRHSCRRFAAPWTRRSLSSGLGALFSRPALRGTPLGARRGPSAPRPGLPLLMRSIRPRLSVPSADAFRPGFSRCAAAPRAPSFRPAPPGPELG